MCPHLQDVCTCLVWKAPCICWHAPDDFSHFFIPRFSLLFPVLFPRCASLVRSPLDYLVAVPRRWVEVLEPAVVRSKSLSQPSLLFYFYSGFLYFSYVFHCLLSFFIVFVILFIGFPYFSSFSEAIPQELSKTGFWLFLHDCAKCSKKIGKSGRPKVLNLLLRLRHMWKRWFWGAALHFFGINVPGCAVLVFRGSPQQVVFKKISRPRNVSLFFCFECIYNSMTRTSVRRYCNFLGGSLAVCHLYSSLFSWVVLNI